ncbi:MAG: trypco2 family protein [Acetobacteraceae bacterium]|jgi:hypothetical protein
MRRTARAVLGLSILLAGGPAFAEQTPPAQAESLTSILERIRQDVGYYEVQAARWRTDIPDPKERGKLQRSQVQSDATAGTACSISDFDFDVTNVQANLQTATAETGTGSVGLRVPLLGKEGSVDTDISWQANGTETVALTRRFHYSAEQLASYQASEDYRRLEAAHQRYHARNPSEAAQANSVLPIADTLIELRESLIRSAEKLPCFEWTDKDVKPESTSITLEFLVQQALDGEVGFNFWIVSAKASGKMEHTNVNTLVVSFAPHGRAEPAPQAVAQQLGQAPGQPQGMLR